MCVNMCKVSTQTFFNEHFGLPLTVNPNFEEGSCEFIFGQTPPPLASDDALQIPCRMDCQTAASNTGPGAPPCHKLPRGEPDLPLADRME